jgi:hypothetical protein
MDEIDLEELKDSQRAKELLNDPLIQRTFEIMEEKYIEAWKDSDLEDIKGREILWQLNWAIGQVRNHFNVILEKGEFHKQTLSRSMKRKI